MGKQNQKRVLTLLRMACLIVVAVLSGCKADLGEYLQSGQVLPLLGLQGRWIGSVVPTDPGCGPTTHGVMTVGATDFGFDPFQSTTIIHGEISQNGRLTGKLGRQNADHQDISIVFEAVAKPSDVISGTLQSGHCQWSVNLHRG